MFYLIARQDLILLRRESLVLLSAILLVAFVGFAAYTGAKARDARRAAVEKLNREADESIVAAQKKVAEAEATLLPDFNQAARNDGATWTLRYVWGTRGVSAPNFLYPATVEMPGVGVAPLPLAVVSIGQSDVQPQTTGKIAFLNFKPSIFNSYQQDNPLNLLAGNFDLAFVAVYLLPLFVIALSYNLLSSEREAGTLVLALTQPVTLRKFVLAKASARFIIVFVFGLIASLAAVVLSGIDYSPGTVLRLAAWTPCVALYVVFWFAVAVLVNARGYSSAMNATVLIGVWLVLVVIVPTLLTVAASLVFPPPSRAAFLSEMRTEARIYAEEENRVLSKNRHVPRTPSAPKAESVIEMNSNLHLAQNRWHTRNREIAVSYEAKLARRQRFVDNLQFLSPAVVVQETCSEIAGTNRARQQNFTRQAEDYAAAWQAHLAPKVFGGELLRAADYDALPRFQFREEPTEAVVSRVLFGLVGLLIPTALIGFFALRALRRSLSL